jgi:hypothetical protein
MPANSASGATLHTIVAVMSFLACLALGGVLTLSQLAAQWTQGLSGSATVQLLPSTQISPDDQIKETLSVVTRWPGVLSARAIEQSEARALLEPWLGAGNVIDDLPMPRLVEVTLRPGQPIELEGLSRKLSDTVPGAQLDDHGRWNAELASFAASSAAIGWSVLLLIAIATLAIIIFATQAGLRTHREIVEVAGRSRDRRAVRGRSIDIQYGDIESSLDAVDEIVRRDSAEAEFAGERLGAVLGVLEGGTGGQTQRWLERARGRALAAGAQPTQHTHPS